MRIAILSGGDPRFLSIERVLLEAGHLCVPYGRETHPHVLLTPVPTARNGATVTGTDITPESIPKEIPYIFGANIPPRFRSIWEGENRRVIDLLQDDRLVEENARLTAEGAILQVATHTKISPGNQTVGVLGSGRIATHLVRLYRSFGSRLHVWARNRDALTALSKMGAITHPLDGGFSFLGECRVLYNTVPHPLLTGEDLSHMKEGLAVELASGQGNLPFEECRHLEFLSLPGIPGKLFPKTAGELMGKTLLSYLNQTL